MLTANGPLLMGEPVPAGTSRPLYSWAEPAQQRPVHRRKWPSAARYAGEAQLFGYQKGAFTRVLRSARDRRHQHRANDRARLRELEKQTDLLDSSGSLTSPDDH